MSDPKHPKPTDQVIDVSDLDLVDITPERIAELSKLREGHALAVKSILNASPEAIQRAGLNPSEIEALAAAYADIERINEVMPAVEKLVELLYETRLVRGDEVATRLSEMASLIRRRKSRSAQGPEIAGPFEPLLTYQSAPAHKAAATKAKAKKEAAEQKEGERLDPAEAPS